MTVALTIAELNGFDRTRFVAALAAIYEHSPWVPERAWPRRPFADVAALHAAMADVVATAGEPRQLALIRAHPELAGKAFARNELTTESTTEQTGAGLTQCSPAELLRLADLNARYRDKFGFPFILAVKGYDRGGILEAFTRRLERDRATEFAESLRQIDRIARFRLDAQIEG